MANPIPEEYGVDFALKDIALNELATSVNLTHMITLLCSGLVNQATGTLIDMNAGLYVM